MKLRLFRNTKTLIDDPEATTSAVIDVESIEEESHPNIAVSPSRKRKINENKEKEEEEKTTSNIKAKKSRHSPLIQQLVASSQLLSTTTTTTAQNFMSFSHNQPESDYPLPRVIRFHLFFSVHAATTHDLKQHIYLQPLPTVDLSLFD